MKSLKLFSTSGDFLFDFMSHLKIYETTLKKKRRGERACERPLNIAIGSVRAPSTSNHSAFFFEREETE
jgi:hypothetical protein